MGEYELSRVRAIAFALPGVSERLSHGAPCFFVQGIRPLCRFHDHHRGDGRLSLWCRVGPGVQEEMVESEPARFFRPPSSASGTFGDWLGVYLDTSGSDDVDWVEVGAILEDAFRHVAPKRLIAELDSR